MFLGFGIDLLIYMFLVRTILWNFISRNPWHLFFLLDLLFSLRFLLFTFSSFIPGVAGKVVRILRTQNPEFPGLYPEFPGLVCV